MCYFSNRLEFTFNVLRFAMNDNFNQIPETVEQVRLKLLQLTKLCYVV